MFKEINDQLVLYISRESGEEKRRMKGVTRRVGSNGRRRREAVMGRIKIKEVLLSLF